MNIPRWIQDQKPDESIESRIDNILHVVINGFTKDGVHFGSDQILLGWIASELIAVQNKIRREKE